MLHRSSRAFRLIAGGCLLALLYTHWASAPHVHAHEHRAGVESASPADALEAATEASDYSVSSDDAHEEHSALIENADSNCAFCRSKDQRENAQASRIDEAFDSAASVPAYADPAKERASALFARLRPARAPPIQQSA